MMMGETSLICEHTIAILHDTLEEENKIHIYVLF